MEAWGWSCGSVRGIGVEVPWNGCMGKLIRSCSLHHIRQDRESEFNGFF